MKKQQESVARGEHSIWPVLLGDMESLNLNVGQSREGIEAEVAITTGLEATQ